MVCLPIDVYTFSFKVKKVCNETVGEPTAPKLRRREDTPDLLVSQENISLPDGLIGQHVGQLMVNMHTSICEEALLGMTVEKTCVCPLVGFY
jgi:hypothetical protein